MYPLRPVQTLCNAWKGVENMGVDCEGRRKIFGLYKFIQIQVTSRLDWASKRFSLYKNSEQKL